MTNSKLLPCVVSIAGSDPSGGAGIQADIKAISATGSFAATIITALTAQNTLGVQGICDVPVEFIAQQIDSVFSDLNVAAIKIGMLHNENVIEVVAAALEKYSNIPVILDPVMVAKNGAALLETAAIALLKEKLFARATLITPNVPEAEKLLGTKIACSADMQSAAISIGMQFKTNVLVKGGHLDGNDSSDVLYLYCDNKCHWLAAERIDSRNTHGTGCSLSSAIASYLAQGYSLKEAVCAAKLYLTEAIRHGAQMQLGHGCGPVDHFYLTRKIS